MQPHTAFLALSFLMILTLICGPGGARRCAATLAANWTSCTAFVWVTGNYTPWAWFWVIDFLCAVGLTVQPVSRWQRRLAYSYMIQFGFHAAFALSPYTGWGGEPLSYLYGLDMVFAVQMLLVCIWTGGHGVYRMGHYHHRRARFVDTFFGWTAR